MRFPSTKLTRTTCAGWPSAPTRSPGPIRSAKPMPTIRPKCAALIAGVIQQDTGFSDEASRLLAVSLVGMAQVSARFWLTEAGGLARDEAAALVAGLAWRGIGGYPRTD